MAMSHRVQDGIDAAQRARSTYSPDWHPILAAVEIEPGHWHMREQQGRCYGIIRILDIGPERGYRAVTWAERSEDRQLIGYYRTLRAAAEATHTRFIRSHSSPTPPRGAYAHLTRMIATNP